MIKINENVVSKQRVSDHGEVYTSEREFKAMLDLVKHETERIESRFLEPACGTGNFLAEVLARKLCVVESRYRKSQLEYERNAVVAVSSIYGIDILSDNITTCRERLFENFNEPYTRLFNAAAINECRNVVRYVLEKNIIHGDALTLKTIGDNPRHIVFSEWSPVNGRMIKRRDFAFYGLVEHSSMQELPLFSDLGEDVFIPEPIIEYPVIHFLRLADAEQD